MKKILLVTLFSFSALFADFGFDVGLQRRWNDSNLWNAGIAFSRWQSGYITTGFNFLPAKNKKYSVAQSIPGDTTFLPHAYFGAYSGYHWRFSQIIRPGVVFGIGWEREEKEVGGQKIGYTDFSVIPYFGLDIHIAVFTFRVSNEGVGCGLNFRIGGSR